MNTQHAPVPLERAPPALDVRLLASGRRRKNERLLRASWPAAALELAYRRRIGAMVSAMQASVLRWVVADYRREPPKVAVRNLLAQDDLASFVLGRAIRELRRYWYKKFDEGAAKLARWFATSVRRRSDQRLKKILRDAGFSVEWGLTPAQRDVLEAIVAENVALIRSIPRHQLDRVEVMVMQSVATGRDAAQLYRDLVGSFRLPRKRAQLIARDQSSKATGLLEAARFVEMKIDECVWMHSSAGREPRPNHVRFGREKKRFDPKRGMWDPDANGKGRGAWIWPGTLINCRCSCRPVVRGFS